MQRGPCGQVRATMRIISAAMIAAVPVQRLKQLTLPAAIVTRLIAHLTAAACWDRATTQQEKVCFTSLELTANL